MLDRIKNERNTPRCYLISDSEIWLSFFSVQFYDSDIWTGFSASARFLTIWKCYHVVLRVFVFRTVSRVNQMLGAWVPHSDGLNNRSITRLVCCEDRGSVLDGVSSLGPID